MKSTTATAVRLTTAITISAATDLNNTRAASGSREKVLSYPRQKESKQRLLKTFMRNGGSLVRRRHYNPSPGTKTS